MIQRYEMDSLVARYVVQLHVLVHAQGHDEADATVGSRIAGLVCVHVAPLEVSYGSIASIVYGYDWQLRLRRPDEHLRVVLGAAGEEMTSVVPLDAFDQVAVALPYLQCLLGSLNAPEIYFRLTGGC